MSEFKTVDRFGVWLPGELRRLALLKSPGHLIKHAASVSKKPRIIHDEYEKSWQQCRSAHRRGSDAGPYGRGSAQSHLASLGGRLFFQYSVANLLASAAPVDSNNLMEVSDITGKLLSKSRPWHDTPAVDLGARFIDTPFPDQIEKVMKGLAELAADRTNPKVAESVLATSLKLGCLAAATYNSFELEFLKPGQFEIPPNGPLV